MFDKIGISDHFDTFLDIMKHSVMLSEKATNEEPAFISKYVNSSKIWKKYNLTFAVAEQTNLGIFLYCDIISSLQEAKNSRMGCNKFVPVSTGNGLCYSFNSLPSTQIYQQSEFLDVWNSVFQVAKDVNISYPTAWGPSRDLFIFLQSFESYSIRASKDFLISFTNEFDPFDVVRQNFEIIPGYFHSFRIVPSQTTTTQRFDQVKISQKCAEKARPFHNCKKIVFIGPNYVAYLIEIHKMS